MKRCLLALLLAVLLLSGCSSSVPEPAASEPAAIEPTTSPTLSPTPEPTPEPTAVPVTAPETAVSLAAPYLLPGQDDTAVRVCWTGARHAEGMCVLYGPAEADGSRPPRLRSSTLTAFPPTRCSIRRSSPLRRERGMPMRS